MFLKKRILRRLYNRASKIRNSIFLQKPKAFDLIRLDNASFLVPVRDNLYQGFIPHHCKNKNFDDHYSSDTTYKYDQIQSDVTKLMFGYLSHLFQKNSSVYFLDLGAWIGDVAIRLAKFASFVGGKFHADCYDPSLAGSLIPFNINLNQVQDLVDYKPFAVSTERGTLSFVQIPGHSDASRLISAVGDANPTLVKNSQKYLVNTLTLQDCLPKPKDKQHVIVKFDIEGLDAKIVMQNLDLLQDMTVVIEFAPHQNQYKEIHPTRFIEVLQKTHTLFDLFYLPRPTRADEIVEPRPFVEEIMHRRRFGYTDILAVPKSLSSHDEILRILKSYKKTHNEYRLS